MNLYNLEDCSGKGVKVAIVDDGIHVSPTTIRHIAGGISITIDDNEKVICDDDYFNDDPSSHGTICAAIIQRRAPDAELYSIKIMDDTLFASPIALIAAIEWAIKNEMDLINLSMGTTGTEYIVPMRNACKAACENGIVIVSSTHSKGLVSYPSAFSSEVISVDGAEYYEGYDYTYHPGSRGEFLARSIEVTENRVSKGSSISAACISAIVSLILEKYPKSDLQEVKQALIKNARRRIPIWMVPDGVEEYAQTEPKKKGAWIKKAALFSYDFKMQAFIRFSDLTDFQISHVVEPVHSSLVGIDAGSAIGLPPINVPIVANLDQAKEADTVIIAQLDRLEKIHKKSLITEVLDWAIKNDKNVFSLSPIEKWKWRNLYRIAQEKGLVISSPSNKLEDYVFDRIDLPSHLNIPTHIDVPVVGVFGTSFNQGQFTTQLALRRELLREGYRIAQIGTEPHCELFGFSGYISLDEKFVSNAPTNDFLMYLERLMLNVYAVEQPHLFVVGSKGGIVPHAMYSLLRADFHEFSRTYTLPAITFLFGMKPDTYILTVNSIDADEYIRDNIDAIEALGKGKTIALTFADRIKNTSNTLSCYSTWNAKMSEKEIQEFREHLEDKFGIPAICLAFPEEQKKLADVVMNHFAVE